jgi:O-acetyl-ADP-ribose deacetylase (regulator of RNase III)
MCFDLPSGHRLLVVAGNIAAEQVDAIVCPTNEQLHLTGGVPASIARAGMLWQFCTNYVVFVM